jgi:hypothetical protein
VQAFLFLATYDSILRIRLLRFSEFRGLSVVYSFRVLISDRKNMNFLRIVSDHLSVYFLISAIVIGASSSEAATSFSDASSNQSVLEISISSTDIDAGVVFPFAEVGGDVTLTNLGAAAVQLDRIEGRNSALDANVEFSPRTLKPGDSMVVSISIQNGGRVGRFSDTFFIYSNLRDEPVAKFSVRGFVDWLIDPQSLEKDVGVVKSGRPFVETLTIMNRPGIDVRLKRVRKSSKWLDAKIIDDGRALRVSSLKGMPWGAFDEEVVLETDSLTQRLASAHLKGEMRGPVVPSSSTIDFGVVRVGTRGEQAVRLVDETGEKLEPGSIKVSGAKAAATITDCIPAIPSCKLLKLALEESKLGAAPRGVVTIKFPKYSAELPLPFGGAIIGRDTVVHDLVKEAERAAATSPSIGAALHASVNPINALEMPVPDGRGPLLKWEMANESPIYGYEIYRAVSADGPFARSNESLIPRLSSDSRIPSIYRWRDPETVVGKAYWYYIGVVYLDGRKEVLNSPQKVVAK